MSISTPASILQKQEAMDDPASLLRCPHELLPSKIKNCLENNVPFKILLFVDSASKYAPFIGGLYPNIKVVFLPPNSTFLIHPVAQGVIAAFKAYYLMSFAQEIPEKTLMQFWKERLQHLMTASKILLGLRMISPRSVQMTSGRRH